MAPVDESTPRRTTPNTDRCVMAALLAAKQDEHADHQPSWLATLGKPESKVLAKRPNPNPMATMAASGSAVHGTHEA